MHSTEDLEGVQLMEVTSLMYDWKLKDVATDKRCACLGGGNK